MKNKLASTFLLPLLGSLATARQNHAEEWQLTLSARDLSDPPDGFKRNDLILTTGIRVKLGLLK